MEEVRIKREVVRIAIVGYYGGKTTFIHKYLTGNFNDDFLVTIWCNESVMSLKSYNRENKIKLILWDTAGNERFKNVAISYMRASNGIIIMYNIRNRNSFEDVLYWIKEIKDNFTDIPAIIIGNMCDDKEQRVISKDEGEKLAQKYDYHFYESSSKLGINIEEPIELLLSHKLIKKKFI